MKLLKVLAVLAVLAVPLVVQPVLTEPVLLLLAAAFLMTQVAQL